MQKLLFFTLLLSAFFIPACKQDTKTADTPQAQQASKTANPDILGGNWIALDFCSRAQQYGSVLETMNNSHIPYAYAISFNPGEPDSVTCFSASESWKLPVKYKADTLELVGAKQGKSIFLIYNSKAAKDNDLTMFDATNETAQMDRFIKSRAGTQNGYSDFLVALSYQILGGTFVQTGKGGGEVQFTPGGLIQGLKDYDQYQLCAGGDCLVAGQDIDIISFFNSKTGAGGTFFGYRFSAQNDTLTIFNMVNKNPNEKGGYVVGKPAYKLIRKK